MGGVDMGDCRLDQLEDIAAGQGALRGGTRFRLNRGITRKRLFR
jgi:hypothetical protein